LCTASSTVPAIICAYSEKLLGKNTGALLLLIQASLNDSAERRIVQFQVPGNFHLAVAVLPRRFGNQSISLRSSFALGLKEILKLQPAD